MIVVDGGDLRQFSAGLKTLEPAARRALQKRIRETAEPIARQVRLAALQLPDDPKNKRERLSKKKLDAGERMGLRAGLAASTEVRIRKGKNPGVRIVVSRSKFQQQTGKARSLPRYVEGLRRRPWRHPVFGNRENWVTQRSRAFLLPTVLPNKNRVREAILKEYQATFARTLERHGIKVR